MHYIMVCLTVLYRDAPCPNKHHSRHLHHSSQQHSSFTAIIDKQKPSVQIHLKQFSVWWPVAFVFQALAVSTSCGPLLARCSNLHNAMSLCYLIVFDTIKSVLIQAHVVRVFSQVHVVGPNIEHTGQRLAGLKSSSSNVQI